MTSLFQGPSSVGSSDKIPLILNSNYQQQSLSRVKDCIKCAIELLQIILILLLLDYIMFSEETLSSTKYGELLKISKQLGLKGSRLKVRKIFQSDFEI